MDSPKPICPVFLQTGFRIFFLGAAFYSVFSILFWMFFYICGLNIFVAMPVNVWHGHEMIYGFTMAVVAGFLLTAVGNWTGKRTLTGIPLLILFMLWLAGRIFAFLPGKTSIQWMSLFDNAFFVFLMFAVIRPVVEKKQWRQFAVLSKLILLFVCSLLFYVSLVWFSIKETHMGLVFAVYMIVSLILTISRRVFPFFIEKGIGRPVQLRNSKWIDRLSLVLIVFFSVADVFFPSWKILPVITTILAAVHIIRLSGWYVSGILSKPLLWVLFAGYAFIILGFILKTFSYITGLSPDYALHAFSYGGIGVMCLGMMSRVSWGHTGRKILEFPNIRSLPFYLLIVGACVRIFAPIICNDLFAVWIMISQLLWMLSFGIFLITFTPILILKRPDGAFG